MGTRRLRHLVESGDSTGSPARVRGHAAHIHDYPLLIHIVHGSALVGVSGESLTLHPGDSLWLSPGTSHSVRPSHDCIMLGPRLSPDTTPPGTHLLLTAHAELAEIALLILVSAPRGAQVLPFRRALDDALTAVSDNAFPLPQAHSRTLLEIVEDPTVLHCTLPVLAARHGHSARQVERHFRAELGLSFRQWRTARRCNRALVLIRAGSGLAAAARAVGYGTAEGLVLALQRLTGADRSSLRTDPAGAVNRRHAAGAQATGSSSFGSRPGR